MAHPRITCTKQFKVNFTAEDWQLLTALFDCADVAKQLNAALEELLNRGTLSRDEVEHEMSQVLEKFADFGAADSEPFYFMLSVLRAAYR